MAQTAAVSRRQWLVQAYRLRDPGLSQLKVLPAFWRFNREPRYRDFLDKMRLPR